MTTGNDSVREREIIEYESAMNEAQDSYFHARPQLMRTRDQERFFDAGFRMAWQASRERYAPKCADLERRNGAMEEYLKSRIRAFPQTHWENFLKLNPEFDTQHPQGESNEQQ